MNPAYRPHLPPLTLIRLITVLASLLLSWLAVTLNAQPNTDAYIYVRTAEIALEQGLSAAYGHYQWAHMSLVMAMIHKITGLSMFQAAYLLNALTFALMSLAFVNLVAALAPTRRVVWLAMLVILSFPLINEFRAYIIRDIGFLGFALIAMLQLIHFNRTLLLRHAVLFVTASLAAALFRPEALLLMYVSPVTLLMNKSLSENNRRRGFLRLEIIALLAIAPLLFVFAFSQVELQQQLQSFALIYQPFLNNLQDIFQPDAALNAAVFGEYGAQFVGQYSGIFLFVGLLAVLLACLIDSLGLVGAPLLAYGYIKRLVKLEHPVMNVPLIWAGTSLLILLAFILLTRFITTRYALMFCTVLLIFIPFIVDRSWRIAAAENRIRRFAALMTFLLLFAFIDSHISFGDPKRHLQEATAWIEQSTRRDAPLVTNEIYLAYETGRVEDYDVVRREMEPELLMQAAPGTIFALTPRGSFDQQLQAEINRGALRLIRSFSAERGADLMVFEKELP
ncbi:MAG: hypothetical protein CMQ46_09360 [Gammaproteobacteria bacterium]|nr:hypothetical protein [Gammaproteobacteria bacterium]